MKTKKKKKTKNEDLIIDAAYELQDRLKKSRIPCHAIPMKVEAMMLQSMLAVGSAYDDYGWWANTIIDRLGHVVKSARAMEKKEKSAKKKKKKAKKRSKK